VLTSSLSEKDRFRAMVEYNLVVEYDSASRSELNNLFQLKMPNMTQLNSFYTHSMQFVMRGKSHMVIGGSVVLFKQNNVSIQLFAILPQKKRVR
jgi:hypothetical protein